MTAKKTKNTVENTSESVRTNPAASLHMAFPGGIEASEARGQVQLVESDVLPSEIRDPRGTPKGAGRSILEAWGFVFGDLVEGDPLFVAVTLPDGWKKERTDHSMWSHVVDERGRRRCQVFYKAAFYDRKAALHVSARYEVDVEGETPYAAGSRCRGLVKEGERVLFTGEWRSAGPDPRDSAWSLANRDATDWFKANLPSDIVEQWARP